MNVTNVKATVGLVGVGTSERPGSAWVEPMGYTQQTVTNPFNAVESYRFLDLSGYINSNNKLTVDVVGGITTSFNVNGVKYAFANIDCSLLLADERLTIQGVTYTLVDEAPTAAYQVFMGVDASATADNLFKAITATGVAGTDYGTGTVAHTLVTCTDPASSTLKVNAVTGGYAGNVYNFRSTTAYTTPVLFRGGEDTSVCLPTDPTKDAEGIAYPTNEIVGVMFVIEPITGKNVVEGNSKAHVSLIDGSGAELVSFNGHAGVIPCDATDIVGLAGVEVVVSNSGSGVNFKLAIALAAITLLFTAVQVVGTNGFGVSGSSGAPVIGTNG